MDASLSELNNPLQTRSFSLPSKLNPINKRIEEELQKLRAKEATSTSPTETISIDLTGLADLYKYINEVLSLPLTQKALSLHHHHEKHVCELMLKGCSNLQNVCSTLREIVLQQTKNASSTRSALLHMKNKGYSSSYYESKVASYFSSRKEVIKRAKGVTLSLKQFVDSPRLFREEEDQRLSTVIKALTCITMINISIFESLSVFLSAPVTKQKSGSLISKLIPKSRSKSVYQAKMGNELMDVDATIHSLCSGYKAEKLDITQKRLEEMIGAMEGVENSLESVYTQLVEAKACLLSMVSFS